MTSRRPLAALALVLALGCGSGSGDSLTSAGESSSGGGSTVDASTSEASGGPTTGADSTTGEMRSCAQVCQHMSECGVPLPLEQCNADCEAADDELRGCILACDQAVCEDLLMCTTLCAHEGDPNATPYGNCDGGVGQCRPEVYLCIASADQGLDAEFTVCTPFCDENDECPVPATGEAPPRCDLAVEPAVCALDCSDGQQCPDDMVCAPTSGMCMWAVG